MSRDHERLYLPIEKELLSEPPKTFHYRPLSPPDSFNLVESGSSPAVLPEAAETSDEVFITA